MIVKLAASVLGWTSIFLIVSMLICAAWMMYSPQPVTDYKFHATLGGGTLIFALVTIIFYMLRK